MNNKLAKVWFFLLISFVIFHSTVTVVYNFPITPFKKKYDTVISSYMNPLFSQTWTLFAPNPANTNVYVEVKLSYEDNQETGWINFSNLIHESSQDSYFSHYQFYADALIQMQNSVIEASNDIMKSIDDEKKEAFEKKFNNKQTDYIEKLLSESQNEKFLGENTVVNSLYGLIYTYFNKQYFSDISHMQVRVSSELFSEYGRNDDPEYQFYYLPKIKSDQLIDGG